MHYNLDIYDEQDHGHRVIAEDRFRTKREAKRSTAAWLKKLGAQRHTASIMRVITAVGPNAGDVARQDSYQLVKGQLKPFPGRPRADRAPKSSLTSKPAQKA